MKLEVKTGKDADEAIAAHELEVQAHPDEWKEYFLKFPRWLQWFLEKL